MWPMDLVDRLTANSVGTYLVDIFVGSSADIPDGPGPYLSIRDTGGNRPMRTHNNNSPSSRRVSAQLVTRAETLADAYAMAIAARDVLDGVYNETLSGTRYVFIEAIQEPTDMGLDAQKRPMVVFNIEGEKEP